MNPNDFFTEATFVEPTDSADRNYVVTKAVAIEGYISMYLSYSMGIENYEESTSFGKTSQALSFISKLNLFTDLGIVESGEKAKMILFAEIRNRFAHNQECSTFDTAYTKEHVNKLKKMYPADQDAKSQFDHLYEDVKLILEKVKKDIYNTKLLKALAKSTMQIFNIQNENLQLHPELFDQAALTKIREEAIAHVMKDSELQGVIMTDIRMDFDKMFKLTLFRD
jgi:hypothetical protein